MCFPIVAMFGPTYLRVNCSRWTSLSKSNLPTLRLLFPGCSLLHFVPSNVCWYTAYPSVWFGRVGPEPLLIFTDNPLLQLRVAAKWMRNSVASQFQPHPTGTKIPTNTIIQRSLCPTHPVLNTRPQTTVNVTPPNIPLFPHYNIILVAYITIFVT